MGRFFADGQLGDLLTLGDSMHKRNLLTSTKSDEPHRTRSRYGRR